MSHYDYIFIVVAVLLLALAAYYKGRRDAWQEANKMVIQDEQEQVL